jgi:uncharacterized membrane protein YfcA
MRGWGKEQQRAIFQPYILVMQLLALAFLERRAPTGLTLTSLLALVPVALLAAHLGVAVFRKLTNKQFNRLVYCLLIVAGASLFLKAV